jgi:preprotein translocase subunit Sec63
VQAQYIAKRDANNIASFNPEAAYFAQNNDSAKAIAALFVRKPAQAQASATGLSRDDVRAEVIAARANGQINVFDTETDLHVAPAAVRQAPTAVAQR